MKRVTFEPPYRVGRKSGSTVLDSKGQLLVDFRDEESAEEYCKYLNELEANRILDEELKKYNGKLPIIDEVGVWEFESPELRTLTWGYKRRAPSFKERFYRIMKNIFKKKSKQ